MTYDRISQCKFRIKQREVTGHRDTVVYFDCHTASGNLPCSSTSSTSCPYDGRSPGTKCHYYVKGE